MAILGVDLGGTKLAIGAFNRSGNLLYQHQESLDGRSGPAVGELICQHIKEFMSNLLLGDIEGIGVAIPGIYNPRTGLVWAPNIGGWEAYPLKAEIEKVAADCPVYIDSDRTCCILGETWKGSARGCSDAIFLTVGTGIAAGIMSGGKIIRGAGNIAGALGWLAIDRNYETAFKDYGCLETYSSGDGMARLAKKMAKELLETDVAKMELSHWQPGWTAREIISASDQDILAKAVLDHCITSWGMTVANLISIFNPEKIIFGGGVFGPAIKFLPQIKTEAGKWAQPISYQSVDIFSSALDGHAALLGAASLPGHHFSSTNPL